MSHLVDSLRIYYFFPFQRYIEFVLEGVGKALVNLYSGTCI